MSSGMPPGPFSSDRAPGAWPLSEQPPSRNSPRTSASSRMTRGRLRLPGGAAEVDQHEQDREDHHAERPNLRQADPHGRSPFRDSTRSLPPAMAGATSWTTILVSRSARWIWASPRKDNPALKQSPHIMRMPSNHHTICQAHSGGNPRNEKLWLPSTAKGPMANRYHTGTITHMAVRH